MRRRSLLGAAMAIGPGRSAFAQSGGRRRRLAIVSAAESVAIMVEKGDNRHYRTLFEELRRLGHIEGSTLTVERYGRESGAASPLALLQQAVRAEPDVIYTIAFGSIIKQATTTIPVVALVADPVALGLAESLARPGGNVTGRAIDLGWSKAYELLREAAPALRRVGLLYHAQGFPPGYLPIFLADRQAAAAALGFELALLPVSSVDDVEPALAGFAKDGGQALIVNGDPVLMTGRGVVLPLALQYRLASVCTDLRFARAGCLLTYGDDVSDSFRQSAGIVDRILKGAKPADLPIEQPTKFTLILNAKTASALGITIPSSILTRADEVIE